MDSNGSSDDQGLIWPAGLRVAVIENNSVYLLLIEQLLLQCNYKVVSYTQVQEAISFITENQQSVELVISDVFFPSDDALLVLSEITSKLDIPTVIMSWTGDTRTVMNYIAHGACDFLIKPLKVKELRNIWQHVFRKQMADQIVATESKSKLHNSASEESITSHIPAMNDEREIRGMITDIRDLKKSRLQWTRQLHHQFIAAVNVIGLDKAAPKKILEIMHVKHLTREQVASHLQKYRLYLKRSSHVITKEVVKLPVSNQNSGLNEIEPENNTSSSQDEDQNNIGMDITDYSYYKGESSSGSHCVIGDPGNCFHETFHDLNYWDSSKQEAGSLFWNFST